MQFQLIRRILLLAATIPFLMHATLAQRVSFSMAARLDAAATIRNTSLSHFSECNTYLIDGKPFYDAPSVLPFFSTSTYRIKLDFAGFHNNTVITPGNYSGKGYRLEVRARFGAQPPRTLAVTKEGDLPAFSLSTGNPTTTSAQVQVNLYQGEKKVADAVFPFEVVPLPGPSEAITTYLPYKYHLQMATMQIIDRENSNNQISTDITFGGTVAVMDGKEYIMTILMEKNFTAGGKELTLSINAKQDYGHRVEFEWQGPSLPLKLRTENGMYAYLTIAPPVAPVVIIPEDRPPAVRQPPVAKERVVAPQAIEKARVTEQPRVAEQPQAAPEAKPQIKVQDVAVAKRFDNYRIGRPLNSEQVRQVERTELQQALRRNPDLLKVKPVAPEISVQEAELAAEAPANTYTLLVHLFNEFGEEDSTPKEITFVVLKK